MKKKFVRLISAVLSAAMTLTAVPLSAFAEGEAHTHDGESNVITTPLDFREKTADENGDGWSWDHDTKTLTLNGVNIQATTEENMMSVVTVPDGTKIVLNGENTIVQTDTLESDTYVLSAVNNKEVNCDGTMTISGDGVLNAENRSTDSMARSLGGSIILNGGTVNATGTVKTNSLEIHNDGVLNANATTASFEGVAVNVSGGITVDGNGSLTAVGCANESTLNSAILLTSNFGDKISVSENGSITVPEGNAARVGIYYSGNNGDGMDAEISGGKVTAYGTKYGIYKVNLIMNGTGSVYTTGGSYAIGQTVPTIDENEFVIKGSTEFKASESAVTGEVKYNSGYYEIGGADAKTVVIKPDTSPRIILGKQTGIFKTEEYEIIEGMTDTKLKGTVYFDITLKNMSDEEFADARGCFGGDEPDLSASIIKTDYGWVCMVCDTEFSVTYDTDNTLTIKCGDIVSNTVQVKSNANRFNKVTQGDNTNRTVFYTNTSQEEKDNYKLVSTYTVDSESISYNWYSTNSAYSADELGAAVSGSNGEFKLADNIPAGNYVLYCDITYSDGDSTETVTEKFTFTYKECAHENGYSDGKCKNCGALCDHSNIDINTGKCNECAHQFVATISTDGSAPTGYDTLADCLDSVTADTGDYVKIYQDIGDTSATATLDTIDVKHNVMIDLNGHKLNNIKLGVNKDVKLALTGTAGSYVTQVYVRKGGSFVIDSDANAGFNTIFVEDSAQLAVSDGAKVTAEQLTVIASVNDDGTTTTSVKLATGMKLGGLTYHRQNNSGALKLGNLLDVTRQALRREDNGNYLDLYKEYGSMGYSVALTVVEHTDADHKYGSGTGKCEECGKPCEHGGDINTDTGICSICGAVVSVALYTDKNGSLKYVDTDELDSLLNEYNGSGTIKLFKDYSKPSAQYDLYGELTIDLNGRQFKIRSITPCKSGKLTIKNSGNPVMLGCNVYPTNDASYAGGTLIIDGDVVLDTSIYVYDSSTVILKDGTYPAGLYARDSKTLYDMLGEGKAFFKADGTLFNASVKEISSSVTLTVKDHSHTYVDGECGCGYVCPHSDVNSETGKCNECEYQYAAVIVKDGAVASVYEENEMGAAFEAADREANTGCTLRVYKNYTGSYTTLSGKFTLWIAEAANVGTLTVSGDITVTGSEKNNRIYGDFNVAAGGKLTFDEKCGAMGTVSVGAGTFDCYSTFGITLNINDASSDVILHGGAFRKICYNGGGDRANAEILTLLAENRIFTRTYGELIDGSKTLLKDGFATTVIVIRHEDHSYDSTTGKCTICGKRCGHTDVDSKTGMCKTCQYEFVATLTVGDKVTGFDSLSDCLSKTSEDSENYVKIYKNIDDRTTINVNHTVTVDLNSHKLYYIELKVNNDNGAGNLTLTGSEDSYISQVDVCGGRTFKIDSDANINFETIFVEAGARFEVSYGANVTVNTLVVKESLKLYGRTTTSVRLATGMRIGTLMYELDRNSGSGNLLLYSLLGEGKALQYDNSGEYVDIYEKFTSKIIHDSFTVVDHYEHSYDKATGKCVCGYVCPHSDVDSKTGVCSICKYQFTAGISGVGTAKYFDNIDDAFVAALSAENNGCTLTLYKHCEITQNVEIGNTTVTVDVNGCSLGGEADISVNNGGVLYLKDSRKSTYYGCIDAPFSVNGGTLINGTADGGSSAADVLNLVINSAKCVEIYGGIFENVYIAHASGVALYGGRYNTICGEESNSTPVNDLLAKGYAFATLNSVTHLPESIVDGSAKTIGDGLTNVMVVAHEHRYNVETGKCPCGVCALAIFTETTQSSETYTFIESETQFKNIAENEADGVLKLTGDVDCIVKGIIINGNKTIDMNGHTLNVSVGTEEISAVAVYGNVTFENSGSSRAVINATGVYSYGMVTVNGDIEFDTFATFEDGDALINAGVFKSIYVQGRSVIEILGSGKALASESGEILNASVQQIYKAGDNIFVKAHPKHTYDDHGNCACGYKCLHDGEGQVNEDSANKVCSECGAKIYAKVTTADGKVKYFDDITEGLRYADKAENKGCVFTLVTSGEIKSEVTLSSGQFTITTATTNNNYVLGPYAGKITIDGADVIAEGDMFIRCKVNVKSGSLTLPEGSSTGFDSIAISGGTVTVSEGVNADSYVGADNLFVSEDATDAKLTIGGGTYVNVYLGQFKLKDVIASGVRVISYDNPTDPTAEKTATALLYSDIAEKNNFDSENGTVSYYLVTKCEHKNKDGSYAFNDSGICKYCNSEFAASVSYTVDGSAKTELFSNICDAFDKANEIGTATVTLYKDITDSERTQEITVMGNVTLELNGKTLGGRYGIARISVSDGGTLTVNGDGDMDTPIYVNENSKLVINGGGYFNSVSVKKGGNAEIGGGTIQGLSVRGNVKLSGGKFNDIEIFNGNLESVLADGYAYKVEDGTWLSIAERAESVYSSLNNNDKPLSVEEAPIKSASIAWVGEEAPVIYRNGEKYLYVDITYELAVGSRGATYSDFVNGNNRIKDYNLYNKYMVHCYEIGKLAAKDGEVEYYIVLKCNGYEYKSNVLKLTLATCSHPKDSFSYENDGFVICGICDALIEAEVVDADGKSLGYADIESAIKLAQENEGSTVKLMSEGVSESVTVTGGRFTVDFNGKKVFYQFDVNGGDVTFTSSVKQADVETLISGIEVNGTDAKVTIDGKIKLGSVTLTSGALAVNSAESYIKELSIIGGNAVIDNAIIGALQTNGGDTVINCVEADSLSVNINGSGSISIVTGTFYSTTCKTGLGMAIASGSRVYDSNMNGAIIYTYDAIQTMTKTDRIFVDKCSHKDGSGSYVLDGNPCPYCNEEIVATVSYTDGGSENTDLFSDIYDAFAKANEAGTATITLYKDITDDITDTIAVTGNVTLELNGKRLSQPGTDVWYSIEVTSGKLTVNGSGLIKRVAVCNGSNAEINGGTFSDFIIKDGGNAVIKGGQFYSLQVSGEGRNVGQLLADGYAYWSFIDSGIWSTIAEREKQDIANVEVRTAPIKSATATVDKTVLYRNGGGARQILFNFNVNTSDGYTISDANKVTVGLYVGDTLIRELDFVGNSYTFANADEISDTDGTVKAHLVIKLNGYEYVTDDVEFEIATCTHPYGALTTDEYDYYRCSLCDASINAILVKTNGDKACYTDNVPEAFEAAQLEENNGCTLELYRGVNRDCEVTQGSFTVLFKKTGSASAVIKVSGGNVKITGDDGCTLSKYPGSSVGYLIAVTGGTVTFDDITINDDSISVSGGKTVINGGTYNKLSVSGGTVTINSGTFSSIDVSAEGKALKDLLGENKAFTTSDGKLFDASKVSESDNSLTVIDHSKHVFDEYGYCTCGYQCAHDDVDTEAGVCRECNTKIYAAITVKSETETTVKYFAKLTEAFEFAAKNENKGCTLKMLRDFFDRNTDINVNGGELTVDMNGFGVYFNSFNGSGTQITIRSDSKCTFGVENGFSMDGGTVTFSGEVSVVCQNVKLNATYFSSYVETLKIDTLILEDGVLLKQLASITNANIANIDCSSEIYLYQILASGSRVDSQLYSDLKVNASSNFDNVRIIRCDHPDGVGRDNRCIYCNSLIAASVSYTENGAEKTEYFVKEDLGKAFAKANSVASATITMLMSSAYDTDYLPVTGDVTLIANGDNAILYNTVKVADGGKLTLRGNANIFAVIAEPGSRLTAEEATRIAYLTVNGGDVKLSGGQYDNITVKDGKITDILGNGYAYKKTEGGAWLTLKEREVSEASGVTVAKAPIVQATLSTEINKLYRNSNANPTLKFNLTLANGSNLNDSYVSKRYGINSYVSGDIIYSSLSALVTDAKLSADEIIDKAGDSDVAEIYYVVTTGDGYEIKSNTVSIDLVDCDHSQVVDPTADKETAGNITTPTYCEICESKFNAKITKGDDVRYYNDLDEAAKDAQKSENEGCTLYPLYNKNGYGGQLVITEGNFTLKYAVRTAFSRPIIINGKAKLTVTGRCAVTAFENQDAFIVRGGDVTFDGLATGSNVTINGGNVTMAANNINCLTIHGGNVSISSGGFAEIVTTVSDKVIADYIDHGFWVQDRGTKEWIDIYSLNKATASSTNGLTVRVCPMQIIKPIDTVYYTNGYYPDGIPSLQISAVPWYSGEVDAKVAYQWISIDENGYETVIEGATDRKLSLENLTTGRYYCRLTYSNAATAGVSMKSDVVTATITECEHSGGEATCTKKAKCEICGAEYGEPLGHDYVVIKVVEPDYRNEGYSVFECTRCKDSYIGNRVPVKPIPDVEEIAVEKTTYNEVDISWKNISGVDGYYVECYVGNQWKQIGFSTDGDRVAAKLSGLSAGLKYKVRIAAYAGRFTAKFRCFYVDTVPSPVWNINTVKATDETVRISWSRNTRADGYKVEWYIDNQWSVKTVTGNNNISAVIDGLCAGTRYKVRVSAYKGDLYSPYTYGYIDTLPSKVTGITQTVTSSSFTLKWDKNESADGYTVQYYADGKWNEKSLVGNDKTTVTIGSLKGYKTYKVRIKAYKGELQSTFDDIYITTAPTKVSGLKVKSAVDSKAVVIWNADANADGYNVGYYIGGKWVEKTITDNKTAMAVLGGLTPYSTYKVRVRAYKGDLYGDYSYTTVTAVLSPVTDIKVVSAKSNSITVKWGKNASADGYKVEIYKGGKWVKKTLKGSTNATVTIGGLRAGSVYKVRIASYKGANTSAYTYANVNTAK
ncbi:Fibronectin type III domain [[Eubacterium] siraeum V10Sc8a]|uniref:Fibronectin type III domain n=1 Tax=[Eubacterium] siraeum V10Sc8a TaxID=717961 RepID=D4MJ93_9FIRM|nr:Fibronectin type III domain [[Eubacterium] siraeum V10Sc8a]